MGNLSIETAGTEEEAVENIQVVLNMQFEEAGGGMVEVKEGVEGSIRALVALEFLTQDAEPSRTMLVDVRNGFNKLIRLEMPWTVQHCWPAGARFAFNYYRCWSQLLIRKPGEPPVTILSR